MQTLSEMPPRERLKVGPFRRILLAVDESQASGYAAQWAQRVAAASRAHVRVLTVLDKAGIAGEPRMVWEGSRQAAETPSGFFDPVGRSSAGRVAEDLTRHGIEAQPTLSRGPAIRGIVDASTTMNADLIVVGSHGAGRWERFTVGSVSESVKNHTGASLLVAKTPFRRGPLLAAIDGSAESVPIARACLALAGAWRTPATLLHVAPNRGNGISLRERQNFDRMLQEHGLVEETVRTRIELAVGRVADTILSTSREGNFALIIMGSRGLMGIRALMLGSASNRVLHGSTASVLLVRGAATAQSSHDSEGTTGNGDNGEEDLGE